LGKVWAMASGISASLQVSELEAWPSEAASIDDASIDEASEEDVSEDDISAEDASLDDASTVEPKASPLSATGSFACRLMQLHSTRKHNGSHFIAFFMDISF
jgi:hypothetical protein